MSWDPVYTPSTEDTLTGYRVIYRDVSGRMYTQLIGPRKSTANLRNLQKFSTYTITVLALTAGGKDATSDPVNETTLEDGK